jgi:hypothetical protein
MKRFTNTTEAPYARYTLHNGKRATLPELVWYKLHDPGASEPIDSSVEVDRYFDSDISFNHVAPPPVKLDLFGEAWMGNKDVLPEVRCWLNQKAEHMQNEVRESSDLGLQSPRRRSSKDKTSGELSVYEAKRILKVGDINPDMIEDLIAPLREPVDAQPYIAQPALNQSADTQLPKGVESYERLLQTLQNWNRYVHEPAAEGSENELRKVLLERWEYV